MTFKIMFFSFHIIDPFIYLAIYQKDKDLYHAIVTSEKNNKFILFSFELMAWMKKITDKIDTDKTYEKSLPSEISTYLQNEFGTNNKSGLPEHYVELEEKWMDVRNKYKEKIEDSIFGDLEPIRKVQQL